MATWRVDLHALNSPTALVTGLPIKDSQIRFSYRLNAPGAFEAALIFDDPAVTEANLAPGKRELRVYRDGVLVWGGYLWAVRIRRPRELTIVGEGYLSRLRRTHVYSSLRYQATAQEQIVRNLVDHVQSQSGGSMGIDTTLAGNHTGGSVTRTRTYCRGDAIWDAIEELTSLDDGLDLEITPSPTSSANKVLKTYQPRKGSSTGLTISTSDELGYEIDAGDLLSRVLTRGDEECSPFVDDRTDATALSDFGLLSDVLFAETRDQADVQATAREELRVRKVPRWQAELTIHEDRAPAWGSFSVGDVIGITSSYGFATFSNKQMRILELEVQVEDAETAFYTLHLDQVVS